MPYSLNGFGTAFYGQRDFREDGTYITTEWVALMCIPIIPIRSFRVRDLGPGEDTGFLGFGSSENYEIHEKRPPNWKQVLFTYGYIFLLIAWTYLVGVITGAIFPHRQDEVLRLVVFVIASVIPVPTPFILRFRAARKFDI